MSGHGLGVEKDGHLKVTLQKNFDIHQNDDN